MARFTFPLFLCLLTSTAPVYAQSAPAVPATQNAPLSESLTGAAKTDFASAQILLNNGDFAGAYAKLGQAYDLSKDPRLLFNMAICARDMHDYARMRTLLVRYKREEKTGIGADERAQVDAALAAIRDLVGAVNLTVNEAGAAVAVDGETIGTTPLDDRVILNLGKHRLTVTKAGFQPAEQVVDVAGGSESALTVTLVAEAEAHPAHLIVASDDQAIVVIDGKEAARGRFDGPLSPGVHQVNVSEAGKVAYNAQVDLRDGETRTVEVTLQNEKHGGPLWPWIAGGVAVATGAAVGGYFLFKSSGSQQGPDLSSSYQAVHFLGFGGR